MMPIAYDTTTSFDYAGAGVSSRSFSHTCTGLDLLLWVVVMNSSAIAPSGVTYGGVAMTQEFSSGKFSVWFLLGPATGANNVVVSWGSNITGVIIKAFSFTGVAGIRTKSTQVSGGTTGPTVNVTATVDTIYSDVVFDALGIYINGGTTVSVGAGQTVNGSLTSLNYNSPGTDWIYVHSSRESAAAAATVTMSWTLGTSSATYLYACPMKPKQSVFGAPAVSPYYVM